MESFDEDSMVAQTVRMYYDVVLRRCLAAYQLAFSHFVSLVLLRDGVDDRPSWHGMNAYEIVSGNLVYTNATQPVFARYQYEAPVAHYPHYFCELLISSLVEELSAVFGHNLNTQAIYRQRINGTDGSLVRAIQEERR
jgi:hypothetical protein